MSQVLLRPYKRKTGGLRVAGGGHVAAETSDWNSSGKVNVPRNTFAPRN